MQRKNNSFGELTVDFDIIIEKSKRKSLILKVLNTKTIKIKAPLEYPDRLIRDFIDKKAVWIAKKRLELEKDDVLLKNLVNFNKIMYFGALRDVIRSEKIKSITFKDNIFYVPNIDFKGLKHKFKRFFIRISQIYLEKALETCAIKLNLTFNSIKTNVYKTKWGSCNSKKDIKLNAALIMLDENLISYVITHELIHLKHLNHSKFFWNAVESAIPDYKKLKVGLKRYNYILKILTG